MTYYREISALQQPFEIKTQDDARVTMVFNIIVTCGMTVTLMEEIVKLLTTASVGAFGTNIFSSLHMILPQGVGPYIRIVETGGREPERIQNQVSPPAYIRPTLQIMCIGDDYREVRTMILAAYLALNIRNQSVVA